MQKLIVCNRPHLENLQHHSPSLCQHLTHTLLPSALSLSPTSLHLLYPCTYCKPIIWLVSVVMQGNIEGGGGWLVMWGGRGNVTMGGRGSVLHGWLSGVSVEVWGGLRAYQVPLPRSCWPLTGPSMLSFIHAGLVCPCSCPHSCLPATCTVIHICLHLTLLHLRLALICTHLSSYVPTVMKHVKISL
jgi:hypothetical protein